MNRPGPLSLAALFLPPDGFTPPLDASKGAEYAARFGMDLEAFWRACPRADWMMWLLGWHEFDLRGVVGAASHLVAQSADLLAADDPARRELARIEEWVRSDVPSRSVDWTVDFDSKHLQDAPMSGRHEAEAAIAQLAAVAKYGRNLGPALPSMLIQLVVWPIRARFPMQPWAQLVEARLLLKDAADILRERTDPALIQSARPPRFMPSSWADAKARWSEM